jgi:hypothetical protein
VRLGNAIPLVVRDPKRAAETDNGQHETRAKCKEKARDEKASSRMTAPAHGR